MLDALVAEAGLFEYWYHAAAYLPMRDYRFALPRMAAMRRGEERWQRSADRRLMAYVRDRIAAEGPLKARDFDAPERQRGGWWQWKPAKGALEQLFMQGDLMAVRREGFEKVYDLTERVLPPGVRTDMPTVADQAAHLLANVLRAHGVADARSVTHLRRGSALRAAVAQLLLEGAADGRLVHVQLPAGGRGWAPADLLDRRAPPAPNRARIISPFDNAVILRHRGQSLFGFDYQIECYLPAGRRRYGYFALPLLYRDCFVGRADCKAHRSESRIEIRALHLEPDVAPDAGLAAALADAFAELAAQNGCDRVSLGVVRPAGFARTLRSALAPCRAQTV
jgi:uncharacterized protein YcaQ